jgi:hypothetical protein
LPARRSAQRFACLREAPPAKELVRRAGASAKAGHAGMARDLEINFIDKFKILY